MRRRPWPTSSNTYNVSKGDGMTTVKTSTQRLPKTIESKVYQVSIGSMRTPPALVTQREFRRGWGDSLASNLDLDRLGLPVLNRRDGVFYVVDGQHRVYALKKCGFGDYDLECRVFDNLSDHAMAEMFLILNNQLPVATFSKFHVCVTAERPRETAIQRLVEANGVKISRAKETNCACAVSALGKVFDRGGDVVLGQVVRTLRSAYDGDPSAFDGAMIEGLGSVFTRYNGLTNEKQMIARLAATPLGV